MQKDIEDVAKIALKVKSSLEALDRDVYSPFNYFHASLYVLLRCNYYVLLRYNYVNELIFPYWSIFVKNTHASTFLHAEFNQ